MSEADTLITVVKKMWEYEVLDLSFPFCDNGCCTKKAFLLMKRNVHFFCSCLPCVFGWWRDAHFSYYFTFTQFKGVRFNFMYNANANISLGVLVPMFVAIGFVSIRIFFTLFIIFLFEMFWCEGFDPQVLITNKSC